LPGKHFQAKRPGCTKTFVLAKTWTASPEKSTAEKQAAAALTLSAPAWPAACPPQTADGPRAGQTHWIASTTDRVTLFQHFLI
jgi:hypothetical protein